MNPNGTCLNDICEWIITKNNCNHIGLIRVPIMVIKRVIIEYKMGKKRCTCQSTDTPTSTLTTQSPSNTPISNTKTNALNMKYV